MKTPRELAEAMYNEPIDWESGVDQYERHISAAMRQAYLDMADRLEEKFQEMAYAADMSWESAYQAVDGIVDYAIERAQELKK